MTAADEYPLGRALTAQLSALSASYCEREGGCHGPDHSERVHRTALYIGRQMDGRLDILSAAALLHDIGRGFETKNRGQVCHAAKGAELAASILPGLGFSDESIRDIVHCIATHRYRSDNPPLSLEAKILYDADKLDSIGAIGIGRAFLFAGQVGARLHNGDTDHLTTRPYSTEDTAYREFQVKMSKVKERLLTPIGRHLANERHAFMEIYFERLEREIKGRCMAGSNHD